MPEYRRPWCPGGTYFLTIVTFERRPLFADAVNVHRLREAMRLVRAERPFDTEAVIVLPDHLHWMLTLPTDDADVSVRVGRMKAIFTKGLGAHPATEHASRRKHREAEVWQRRFYDHVVRDEQDYANCMDYLHYNPVQHGYCQCPHDWPHGSFLRVVRVGVYETDWSCSCGNRTVHPPTRPRYL